jgi:hypothetical protein
MAWLVLGAKMGVTQGRFRKLDIIMATSFLSLAIRINFWLEVRILVPSCQVAHPRLPSLPLLLFPSIFPSETNCSSSNFVPRKMWPRYSSFLLSTELLESKFPKSRPCVTVSTFLGNKRRRKEGVSLTEKSRRFFNT